MGASLMLRALGDQAANQGKTVEQVRRERQGLYDLWLAEQASVEAEAAAGRLEMTRGTRPGAGG